MDAALEKLREANAVSARLADGGDHHAAYTYLSTRVVQLIGTLMAEEDRRDSWSDKQEAIQYAKDAAREQPSYS